MKKDKENPTVTMYLTDKQALRIRNWSGCVVSKVSVSAYSTERSRQVRAAIPIKLEPNQIEYLNRSFLVHSLTVEEIIVYDVFDEGTEGKLVQALAVARKSISIPRPPVARKSISIPRPRLQPQKPAPPSKYYESDYDDYREPCCAHDD